MGPRGAALELGMALAGDEPRMAGQLHHLHEDVYKRQCLRFAMSSREAMDYATAMRVSAKYSEKPVAASTPEMIQKRTTTFVSLQPFFSKWWCNGAMRKMRFFVFL